jgi:uroporphyrinogen decarboxylase
MKNDNLNHRERIEKCIAGEKLSSVPVALWRHFPVDDQNADSLAAAVINFQKAYEFDLVKVTPASSYCIKDWGVTDQWASNPHGTRDYHQRRIHTPEDWLKLEPLDPRKGSLGQMLTSLRRIVAELISDTPIIQTIFSPLSQAKNLVGPETLLIHIRKYPDALEAGLKIIEETTHRFIKEISKTGIDGIFYAVQHAQYGLLSQNEFDIFGRKYDLNILNQLPDNFWLNVGHIHGDQIMFDKVLDYPIQVLNWHDQETYPSLSEARQLFNGVLCGGLRQEETMVLGTPQQVIKESKAAIKATNGLRFILGTGCVLPIIAPHGNIIAAKQAAAL